jgi:predicted amidohydrolase
VNAADAKKLAESIPGASVDALIDLSMKHRIYIVVGLVEKDGDKYYNTAVITGPEGLVGKYRKMHLCEIDKGWASPGDLGFPHFNIPVGRVGLLIGHDTMFPEAGRMLALGGVDLICCPAALNSPKPYGLNGTDEWHNYPIPRGYSTMHWHLWRVRGGENNCYFAFANQIGNYIIGEPCVGRSGIFGPDTFLFPRQEVILTADEEEMGTYTIDTSNCPDSVYPTNVVRRKDLVSMRQPLWYDVIVDSNPPVLDLFK